MFEIDDNDKFLMFLVATVIIIIGVAAQIVTPEGHPPIQSLPNIFYAALTGAVIGLLGYFQKTELPKWEIAKFLTTLIISVFAGVIAYEYGFTYDNAVTWLLTIGFDVLAERILNVILRQIRPLLVSVDVT